MQFPASTSKVQLRRRAGRAKWSPKAGWPGKVVTQGWLAGQSGHPRRAGRAKWSSKEGWPGKVEITHSHASAGQRIGGWRIHPQGRLGDRLADRGGGRGQGARSRVGVCVCGGGFFQDLPHAHTHTRAHTRKGDFGSGRTSSARVGGQKQGARREGERGWVGIRAGEGRGRGVWAGCPLGVGGGAEVALLGHRASTLYLPRPSHANK